MRRGHRPPQYIASMVAFRIVPGAAVLIGLAGAQEHVSFRTQDGRLVYGNLYGKGDRRVMYRLRLDAVLAERAESPDLRSAPGFCFAVWSGAV
jgi:hypothetical protein